MIIHPDWTAIEAVIDSTEYSSAFVGCILYYDENAPTSYCLANGTIVLHQTRVDATLERLVAYTIHEICHIRLWHHARAKQLNIATGTEHKTFNVAADLVVDTIIIRSMSVPTDVRKIILGHITEIKDWLCRMGCPVGEEGYSYNLVETVYAALLQHVTEQGCQNTVGNYDETSIPMPSDDLSHEEINAPTLNLPDLCSESADLPEMRKAESTKATYFRKQAWDVLHNHFKVSFGHRYWTESLLSQRHMLNRTIGGLRMQSRKRKVDASTDAKRNHAHSDVIIFMDVSGSIHREWVDLLVDGIHSLAIRSRLKGATVITYNSRIKDVISLKDGQSITTAQLRIGGGTNINQALADAVTDYPHLMHNTKQIVVLTDGEDDPIDEVIFKQIKAPLLSVVFAPMTYYNKSFFHLSKGEKLYLPELLAY